MAKLESVLAVDIGMDSLKMAEFVFPQGGGMVLEKFAFAEYGADLKEEERGEALRECFKNALHEHKFHSKKIAISVSSQSAFIRFVKLPPMGSKEGRVRQIVEYEAKQTVPFPIDEVVWDYQLIGGGENAEGAESEIEVMFVVIKNDIIKKITDVIEEAKMEVTLIDVAPTACYNAARANQVGGDECVMILNIGGRNSSLIFIDSGRFYVRPIPIAGYTVTQQIAREFSISFAEAEEMKRRHGFVALGGAYEEPDSEVAATVSKIVRNVMTRLHGEINRSINVYRAQEKGSKPTKLWLAGGSSVMAFTPRFFSEKLKIPVDYFNPFQVVSLAENINRESLAEVAHMFSEVIGLGLRQVTTCPIEISMMPDTLKKHQAIRKKTPYFYASAAAIVLCLGVIYFGVQNQKSMSSHKLKIGQDQVDKTQGILNRIDDAKKDLETHQRGYELAKKKLEFRGKWFEILNDVQGRMPDVTWIIDFSPRPDPGNVNKREESEEARFAWGADPMSIMRGKGGGAKADAGDVVWLKLKGHTLIEKDKGPMIEELKQRLQASKYFEELREIDFIPAPADMNITEFELALKLKEPLKK